MVDPIDYTRGNGFGQGLQLAGLYQDVQQRRAQAEQEQQQQQAMQQFQSDWQGAYASGDPKQMDALVAKYPGQMEIIKNGLGLRNSQHQQAVNDMANDFAIARQVGTPQAIAQAISKHPDTLKSIGATPEEAMQMAVSDPNGFDSLVHAVRLSTMAPDKQIESQQNQQKIDETIRNNNLENDRVIRGQNIAASNSAADRQIRLMQLRQDALVKQAANETNDLKRQELQLKVDANQQALQEKQQQVIQGKNIAYDAAKLARSIASDSYLDVITGPVQSRLPKFEGGSVDLINKAKQLDAMLTADNLKILKGSTSDKDIDFVKSLSSGLNVGDNGIRGSYDATKKKLNLIAEKLEKGLGGYTPLYAQQATAASEQQATSGYQSLWGD